MFSSLLCKRYAKCERTQMLRLFGFGIRPQGICAFYSCWLTESREIAIG